MALRVLALSDTHLGLDLPARPRSDRRPRGEDFFASFEAAIAPAFTGEADVVVHCGDLFYRSRIPTWLAARVFGRLADLGNAGIDVVWVPGNHERSAVPRALLLGHPRVHVLDRPRTVAFTRDGLTLAISGFPFSPTARADFSGLLERTGYRDVRSDARLLAVHQAVEGAAVEGFVFRNGEEVVRGSDLRALGGDFAAVVSGHVHRHQVLQRDLAGRPLGLPVLYTGSTERTSSAERHEPKGFLRLTIDRPPGGGAAAFGWRFEKLPVRPMVSLEIDPRGPDLAARLQAALARLPARCVARLRLAAAPGPDALPLLRAASLRALAPEGVEVTVAWGRWVRRPRRGPASDGVAR
jgi:exonuclease SbcD